MPSLAECQRQFARELRAPVQTLLPGLCVPEGAVPAERFAVYRNNVAVGLIEALRASFLVVNRLVGDEFFGAMANAHSTRNPPSSPVLLAYGANFPDFVAAFEPAAVLPYLADIARIEWLWIETFHAADAAPLAIEALQGVPPAALPDLCLTLHPTARFVRLAYPVLAIWRAHQGPDEPTAIELGEGPEHLLLTRPDAQVEITALSAGTFAFLTAIEALATISVAVEAALAAEPSLAVADIFAVLFGAGAFSGFTSESGTVEPEEEDLK